MPHTPTLWTQSGTYPAQADRQLLAALWPGGGGAGKPAVAVANTMQVTIPPGWLGVALQPGQGTALCHWDTPDVLTLDAAGSAGRWDLIICQVRDPDLDGGLNSDFIFAVVKGTEHATAPPFPTAPPNAAPVAYVPVSAGVANLNGLDLQDRRPLGHVEVWQLYAPALPNSSPALVPFSVIESGAGWDLGANQYHCPMDGRYRVDAAVMVQPSNPAPAFLWVQVKRNGVSVKRGTVTVGNVYANAAASISAVVLANAGDTLLLEVVVGGTGFSCQSGADNTYLSFTYLGAQDSVPAASSRPATEPGPPTWATVPEHKTEGK